MSALQSDDRVTSAAEPVSQGAWDLRRHTCTFGLRPGCTGAKAMNYDVLDRVNNCILNNVQYADLFKEIYDLVRDLDKQHLLEMKHLKALNRVFKNEIKGQRKDIDDLLKALISIADHRVDSGKHWRVEYNAMVEKARQTIRCL
jgi:hypothetical protein